MKSFSYYKKDSKSISFFWSDLGAILPIIDNIDVNTLLYFTALQTLLDVT